MSLVNEWTKKIAEASVPEEIDLAPSIAHAFFQAEKSESSYFKEKRKMCKELSVLQR